MTKNHDEFGRDVQREKGHGEKAQRDEQMREDVLRAMARWGTLPVPVAPKDVIEQRQQRGIATLRASIGSAKREGQARRMRFIMSAVAAAALAVWGGVHAMSSSSMAGIAMHAEAGPRAFVDGPCEISQGPAGWVRSVTGRSVSTGDRVRALGEPVSIRLDRITSAHVMPTSVLGITALGERRQELQLVSGTAEFEVDPKRAAQVVVRTEGARILVTGTAFSVTAGGIGSSAWSEVIVSRGRVEIAARGKTFVLGAGEAWSSRDGLDEASSRVEGARPVEAEGARAAADSRASGLRSEGALPDVLTSGRTARVHGERKGQGAMPAEPERADGGRAEGGADDAATTTLSEENRLLRAALSARNGGNAARCVALLGDLLSRFPGSPLRQEAVVAQFRCLLSSGNVATAQRVAQRYLSEYPSGFARDEARDLIVGAGP